MKNTQIHWGKGKTSRSRKIVRKASLLLASTAAFSSPAFAQQSEAEPSGGAPVDQAIPSNTQIEDIVVTAQKRSENVQKVPIAISALGGEALTNRGFDSLATLTKLAPSIQLSNFGPIAFVTLRGIGNENSTAGGDPGVAFHFDGVYVGRPVGTLFSAFDSERVEILRGPQGTLYGRNATGGSINYITKKPVNEFEGNVDVTLGNYDMWRLRAAVNIPLTDGIKTRVVGYKEKRDGFVDNSVAGGTEANDADNYGIRGHILAEVTSNFTALISGAYIHSGGVGSQPELRTPFPGSTTGQNLAGPPIPGTNNYLVNGVPLVNDLRPFHEAKNTTEFQDNTFRLISATLDLDLGPAAIKSITAYAKSTFNTQQDADFSSKNLGSLNLNERARQFSQEIQLSSTAGPSSDFNWILGAYYFHEKGSRQSTYRGGRYDIVAAAAQVPYGFQIGGDVTSESYAFFGQATVRPTDRWGVTGGLRYTHDDKSGTNRGFQLQPPAYSGPVNGNWQKVTYRIATDYQITDSILGYASYSTGYKSGGINQAINPNVANAVFDPEFVKAAELGLKSQLFDRRLQLNVSAYRNKYDSLQFQVFGPVGPQAFNAEGATVKGIELEVQAAPVSWLRIDGSGAYTDASFDSQIVQGVQLGGNRVQRTPEWTFNLGGSIDFPLGDIADARLRADYSYTGSIYYTAFNRNVPFPGLAGSDFAPSFQSVDLRFFLYSKNRRWTGELFMTNVFDTVQIGNVFRGPGFTDVAGGGGPELITYKPPRQFGVRVSYSF